MGFFYYNVVFWLNVQDGSPTQQVFRMWWEPETLFLNSKMGTSIFLCVTHLKNKRRHTFFVDNLPAHFFLCGTSHSRRKETSSPRFLRRDYGVAIQVQTTTYNNAILTNTWVMEVFGLSLKESNTIILVEYIRMLWMC